jgi:serine/threonine protein kinase
MEKEKKSHSKKDKERDKEKLKVKIKDYELLDTVGLGSFGRVRLCKKKKTNKTYVMKILKKNEIIKQKQVDHVYSEYNILSILNHPFIVQLEGLNFEDPKYLYLILEYIQGGELFTLLRSTGSFPVEQTKFYIAHIITIFEYLHSKNIIYRDLKPENILVNKTGYLKLTDFGFAKVLENDKTYTLCGTPEYLAPEIILNKGHGKPVDWWTLGILLYEMLVGIDPFSDDDPMKTYKKIIKGKINFPKDIDKDAKSLIKHLLTADTTKRYGCLKNGVKDILNHRFFNGFDWKNFVFLKMKPPYIPPIKSELDTSNFEKYPDSENEAVPVDKESDPFLKW